MLDWIWVNAEKHAAISTVLALVVGGAALFFAAWQIASARTVAMQTTALQAYQTYLRACIDRPHLGTWKMFSSWSGITSIERLEDQTCEKVEAYVWALSDMLMTMPIRSSFV